MLLLDKVPDPTVRDWYAAQDVQHGWSSAVLSHHITTGRHARVGMAPNNFPEVLAPAESDQTREILQDPYALEFLALEPRHSEQDLEVGIRILAEQQHLHRTVPLLPVQLDPVQHRLPFPRRRRCATYSVLFAPITDCS